MLGPRLERHDWAIFPKDPKYVYGKMQGFSIPYIYLSPKPYNYLGPFWVGFPSRSNRDCDFQQYAQAISYFVARCRQLDLYEHEP